MSLSDLPESVTAPGPEIAAAPVVDAPVVAPGEVLTNFRVIRLDAPAKPAGDAPAPASAAVRAPAASPSSRPAAAPRADEIAAARQIAAEALARPGGKGAAAKGAASAFLPRATLEGKLATANDPAEMLRVLDLEVALQRSRRLSGAADKQTAVIRVLSVFMFCVLVAALLGAMWYLQTLRVGHPRSAQRAPASLGG